MLKNLSVPTSALWYIDARFKLLVLECPAQVARRSLSCQPRARSSCLTMTARVPRGRYAATWIKDYGCNVYVHGADVNLFSTQLKRDLAYVLSLAHQRRCPPSLVVAAAAAAPRPKLPRPARTPSEQPAPSPSCRARRFPLVAARCGRLLALRE